MSTDAEEREAELMAVEAIYPDLFSLPEVGEAQLVNGEISPFS